MPTECNCQKKRPRAEDEKKNLINRLKRIEGQVRGVVSMLEADAYCIDILTQVSAIDSALRSFSQSLLKSHIEGCVVNGIREGDKEIVDELVNTVSRLIK